VSAPFPPIGELLPHAGPMRLLEAVIAHDPECTRCRVEPSRSELFRDATGRIPAWVGIEYMAQCIAAHGGLLARARGEAPRPGLLLGSRRLVFRQDAFEPGRTLEVRARHVAGHSEMLAFECAVLDPGEEAPLAEGRLNVLLPRDLAALGGNSG